MTRAKSQTAYELIKQKIFDGVYPPLSDISEEILQQELGISRTPIHEALQRLGDVDPPGLQPAAPLQSHTDPTSF